MRLPDDSPELKVFRVIWGQVTSRCSSIGGVCYVYSENGPKTLSELRWELFRTKNSEGEMLPPTLGALLPHTIRANFISRRDKSYTAVRPLLPPIEENGWNLQDGVYI